MPSEASFLSSRETGTSHGKVDFGSSGRTVRQMANLRPAMKVRAGQSANVKQQVRITEEAQLMSRESASVMPLQFWLLPDLNDPMQPRFPCLPLVVRTERVFSDLS